MTDHGRALDLAAAALDWDLTPAESAELSGHLATCARCQRAKAIQDGQATVLRSVTYAETPVAVRSVVVGAASAGARRTRRATWTMLAAAALLALAAVTAAVGAYLREQESEVLPRPAVVDPAPPAPMPSALSALPSPFGPPTWMSDPEAAAAFGGEAIHTVVDGPAGFVAFATARADLETLVWVSADGATWEHVEQPSGTFGGGQTRHAVAGGPGYVALLNKPSDTVLGLHSIWTSRDGRIWARDPDPSGEFGKVDILGMASVDGVVLVLVNDASGERRLLRSDDGTAWRESPPPNQLVTGLNGVQGNSGFVIVGLSDPRSPGRGVVAWHSMDGRSWTPTFESDGRLRRVVGTGTRLLAEGGGGSEGEFTLTSVDGRGWQPVPQELMPGFNPAAPDEPLRAKLEGGNGGFLAYAAPLAFDEPLTAWTSVDGENWSLLDRSAADPAPVISPRPRAGAALREQRVLVREVVPVADGWVLFGEDRVTGRALVWSIR